jgi:hypothetical protein
MDLILDEAAEPRLAWARVHIRNDKYSHMCFVATKNVLCATTPRRRARLS